MKKYLNNDLPNRQHIRGGFKIRRKKGQIIGLDVIIAVSIFLVSIVFFLGFTVKQTILTKDINKDAEDVTLAIMNSPLLSDQYLTTTEEILLADYSCEQLQKIYNTRRNFCIYFQDEEGNVVPLSNYSKYSIGCPDINVSDYPCGYNLNILFLILNSPLAIYDDHVPPNPIAVFTNNGNIVLNGTCTADPVCTEPADAQLVIQDALFNTVAYIDNVGNMCVEDTTCNGLDDDCNNLPGGPPSGSLVILDPTGKYVSYIGPSVSGGADMCLIGSVQENSIS